MSEDAVAETKTFLETSKVREVLQEGLNLAIEKKPEDLAGFLSKFVKERALPPTIERLVGREVLDSRGNPTVEVDVYANYCGEVKFVARSSAPSGASTGSNEAHELRDGDKSRYGGKGTLNAANNVTEKLSPALKGVQFDDLYDLDKKIRQTDRTELKTNIGGNACTATSFALAEAAAKLFNEQLFIYLARQFHQETPEKFHLPRPFFNIINGGKHAGGNLKIQEFMVAPSTKYPFPDQLRIVAEVYQKLGVALSKKYGVSAKNLGDEGGYAPLLNTPDEALDIIEESIKEAGYVPGEDISIGLDAAASEFYDGMEKLYEVEVGMKKTGSEMVEYWKDLVERHPAIISIEDGLDEKDHEHWILLNQELGENIQLVGDDLYTTNPKTIEQGLKGRWCNALLLKVNQIGTISEAMKAASLILKAGQSVMVSHRSGETCNSVISDLAVAIGAQAIKTGSTARGERIQKYTRLLQIYEFLKENNMLEE
jgi:enolase